MRIAWRLIAFALLLIVASPLQAFDQTTNWQTIATPPLWENGRPLFLTRTSQGVKLEPYRSGALEQLWAVVWTSYPNAVDVDFDESILSCLSWPLCEFHGHAAIIVKLVSRTSGGCLVFDGSIATTAPCSNAAGAMKKQSWNIAAGRAAIDAHETIENRETCLAGFNIPDNLKTFYAGLSKCNGEPRMRFVIQAAESLSCQTDWNYNLCFIPGKN